MTDDEKQEAYKRRYDHVTVPSLYVQMVKAKLEELDEVSSVQWVNLEARDDD